MTGLNIKAEPGDVVSCGKAIFAFRKNSVADPDPRHRHPMLYKEHDWDKLPPTEQMYYCDMAASALIAFGFSIPVMPVIEHVEG